MEDGKPKIEIPDPQSDAVALLKGTTSSFQEAIIEVKNSYNFLVTFVVGVMAIGFLVLLFALASMIIQTWTFLSSIEEEARQLKIQEESLRYSTEQQKLIMQLSNTIKSVH